MASSPHRDLVHSPHQVRTEAHFAPVKNSRTSTFKNYVLGQFFINQTGQTTFFCKIFGLLN